MMHGPRLHGQVFCQLLDLILGVCSDLDYYEVSEKYEISDFDLTCHEIKTFDSCTDIYKKRVCH